MKKQETKPLLFRLNNINITSRAALITHTASPNIVVLPRYSRWF
jgi:hypothetical protein